MSSKAGMRSHSNEMVSLLTISHRFAKKPQGACAVKNYLRGNCCLQFEATGVFETIYSI